MRHDGKPRGAYLSIGIGRFHLTHFSAFQEALCASFQVVRHFKATCCHFKRSHCFAKPIRQNQINKIKLGHIIREKSSVMCPIFCQYGELNVSELARVCNMSRTRVYNQVKRVCKLACERANADCSTSVSAVLKHSTQCRRLNGVAR